MFKFENKLCPVCRERFHDGDDIAVCPECGTPHHRACYFVANKCALEELHSVGFIWNGRLPDEPMPVPDISELPGVSEVSDGAEKSTVDDETALTLLGLSGLNEQEREEFKQLKDNSAMRELLNTIGDNKKGDDGVSMQELIAFTGTSVWHYCRAFNSFRGTGSDGKKHYASFNFCSGVFTPVYQFYHRMDLLGIISLLVTILPTAVIIMTGGSPFEMLKSVPHMMLNIVGSLPMILLCIFGDYLFYLKAVKCIHKIRERFEGDTNTPEYLRALAETGKPSFARAALGALAWLFVNICVTTLGGL